MQRMCCSHPDYLLPETLYSGGSVTSAGQRYELLTRRIVHYEQRYEFEPSTRARRNLRTTFYALPSDAPLLQCTY